MAKELAGFDKQKGNGAILFGNAWDVQFAAETKEPFADGSDQKIVMVDMIHGTGSMNLTNLPDVETWMSPDMEITDRDPPYEGS